MPPHSLAGGGLVPARSLFLPPVRGWSFRHRFLVGGLSPPSVTGRPSCAGGERVNAKIISDAYVKMLEAKIIPESARGVSFHLGVRSQRFRFPGVAGVACPGVACPGVASHLMRVEGVALAPGVSLPFR